MQIGKLKFCSVATAGADDHVISITSRLSRQPGSRTAEGRPSAEGHNRAVAARFEPGGRSLHHRTAAAQRKGQSDGI